MSSEDEGTLIPEDLGVFPRARAETRRAAAAESTEPNVRPRTVWLVREVNGAYWIENSGANRIAGGWCNEFEQVLGHELPENSRQRVRLHVEVLGEVQRTAHTVAIDEAISPFAEREPPPHDARLGVYTQQVEECENEAHNAAGALARAQAYAADTQRRLDDALDARQRYIDSRTDGRLGEWQENAMRDVFTGPTRPPSILEEFNRLHEIVGELTRRIDMRDGASLTGGEHGAE